VALLVGMHLVIVSLQLLCCENHIKYFVIRKFGKQNLGCARRLIFRAKDSVTILLESPTLVIMRTTHATAKNTDKQILNHTNHNTVEQEDSKYIVTIAEM